MECCPPWLVLDVRGIWVQSGAVLTTQLHLATAQGLGFEIGELLVTDVLRGFSCSVMLDTCLFLQMRELQLGVLTC